MEYRAIVMSLPSGQGLKCTKEHQICSYALENLKNVFNNK